MSKYGIIDLCCGMGGLSHAARESGLTVWAGVDKSREALSSFAVNFPRASAIQGKLADSEVIAQCLSIAGLVNKKGATLVVVSGPPCQGFSEAGPRKVKDPRNEILVSAAKAVAHLSPAAAIVENVSNLRKKKNLPILRRFRAVLNAAGYHVYGLELNALDFGAPQKRRRMIYFILARPVARSTILDGLRAHHRPPRTVGQVLGDLPVPPVRPRDYDPEKDNGYLPNHYAMQHSERVQEKIALIEPGTGPLSYRRLDPSQYAATLLSGHRAPPAHYEQPRSITTREALRLQGFPDSFRVMGYFANQMEQVTNAVPAALGRAIIKVTMRLLGEDDEEP